jgi:hypothetical protein
LGALAAVFIIDGGNHARGALEVEDRFLKLGIEHIAVGDHQHAVKELLMLGVVQVGEEVGRPGNRVGFAGTRGVLDQVTLAGAMLQDIGNQLAGGVQLVVAGEDDAGELFLVVALADQVTAQDFQPAIALPDFFPEVSRGKAFRVGCVTRAAFVAPIEGQEAGRGTGELGGHHDFALAHREMHQGTTGEGQQRLHHPALGAGMAVEAVLIDGIAHALGEVGFEFGGGHGNAIDEQAPGRAHPSGCSGSDAPGAPRAGGWRRRLAEWPG